MSAALTPRSITVTADDAPATTRRWLPWLAILALVFLLHSATVLVPFHYSSTPPARMPVQTIDPAKIEAIRKQWDKQAQKLLLDDKSKPTAKDAPKDARYFSDRNIRVEKEQRARDTTVIPKPGTPNTAGAQATPRQEVTPETKSRPTPQLGTLGVPFKLDQPAKPKPRAPQTDTQRARTGEVSQRGGAQTLDDQNLPEGSENLLNAQESVYYSFYARAYEAVGPIWSGYAEQAIRSQRIRPGDYVTQVELVLDREGNLLRVERLHSSGVASLDQAVDAAWRKVARLPNPPSPLLDQNGEVHTAWTFTVRLGRGEGGLQLLPPERDY